ncbi:MAG: tetratricopeptide repeat protein, partial [Macromonas sp.]
MPRTLPPAPPSTLADATVSELSQADALRKAGQWADACRLYQTVQAQQPNNAVVAHNLALCHLALGQVEQAVEQSRRAVQLQPTLWQSALVWA